MLPYQILASTTHGKKKLKSQKKTSSFRYQLQVGMIIFQLPNGSYSVSDIQD